jgi:hypothetical protein
MSLDMKTHTHTHTYIYIYVLGLKLQKYNSTFGNPIHHPKTDALVLKVYCSDTEGQQYIQQLSYCAAT